MGLSGLTVQTHCLSRYSHWKRPRMSNPRMSNPKLSNAKMSNRVLIRTVSGESTWNDKNHLNVLLSFSSWLLGSGGKRVVSFFGNDTERTLCTESVDTRNRGDSVRMIVTIGPFTSLSEALAGQIIHSSSL